MRLFARVRRTEQDIQALWLLLAGMIGAGTIWSTHFVSMLAYESSAILGYEPILTVLSLLVAILTTTLGFYVASLTQRSYVVELGGAILGVGISAMHYIGMAAITVAGTTQWDMSFVVFSVLFGAFFGAIATNRIARPVTRFCKYGGSLSFILAVALMHFTSMGGLTIIPMELVEVSSQELISNEALGAGVIILMSVLFLVTYITNLIDYKNTQASAKHFKYLALNDALTGILNRFGCEKHLENVLSTNLDDTSGVAVFVIDLDRFKDTNDVYGHTAGDHLLRVISERITDCLKDGEMIGRFGGDEFLAVKSMVFTKRDAKEFGERIQDAIQQPVEWETTQLSTGASIGFSMYPRDGQESLELIEMADRAMYYAKASGSKEIVAYDAELDTANKERIALTNDLKNSIKNDELEVYYQLQNDTDSREIVGVEALLRWNHPKRGQVSPGVFIPIAEETGFIKEIGDWVLEKSCMQAVEWEVPIKVAVNVAALQICDANFPNQVKDILHMSGLPASRLEIEITESGIISDMGQAAQVIRQLKSFGVKIAMDDFGTGFSSLATLQRFPFDKIKIDREFIKEIETNRHSKAIVSSTLILAESLDIPVLAEGVETEDHMLLLNKQGCNQVQGFLFGKPMPNKDLREVLLSQFEEQENLVEDETSAHERTAA
jgi:diguanylate cyclase (GGDEF)-like protein